MKRKADKLTTSQQTEAACIRLFNRIDRAINKYIASATSDALKEQAMRNAVAMLEILKIAYRNDIRLHSNQTFRGVTGDLESCGSLSAPQCLRQ